MRPTDECSLGAVSNGPAHWTFNATYANGNYNQASGDATVTINKADATVVITPYSGTHDALPHSLTGTAKGVGGIDLSASLNLGASFTNAPGGTATWTFTGGTNYNNQTGTAALTINRATLTVTPDNKSMVLHGTVPPLTFQIAGFKGTDKPTTLTTQPTCTTTATSTSNVGPYPITCSGGTATNYVFDDTAVGKLTILYATGTICSNGMVGHQVQQPINMDGSSVFKYGSTVPTKFTVCDAGGTPISSTVVSSFVAAAYVNGTVSNVVNETIYSTTPDTAFRWDPTAQQWIFNLSTSGLAKNATAVFIITLNDRSIVGPVVGGVNALPGASSFQFGLK